MARRAAGDGQPRLRYHEPRELVSSRRDPAVRRRERSMAVALLLKSLLALAPAVSLDGHALHFLALNVRNGHEQYSVHVQRSDAWEPAALEHASGDEWRLSIGDDTRILHADPPDAVFSAAMGDTTAPSLRAAAPHWPPSLLHSLETRRLGGDGTIAFDATTFLELLATTPVDAPLLLPDAARKLGLDGLARARTSPRSYPT